MNERATIPAAQPPSPATERTGAARLRPAQARVTAGGRILDDLRQRILTLALKPGAPLSEKELTVGYGVSRTPVREALIRLAEEGLVDIVPQSGTFVGRIPQGALPEAVVVRKALEGAAIGYALEVASDDDLERLAALIARQEALASIDDQPGFHAADEAFHATLAEIAGHPGLWRIAQQAKLQIDRCRLLTLPAPGRMQTVMGEHRDILAALRRRDRAAALAAMERHLSSVVPDAEAIRARYPQYFI
jgi:DNA-binding GntR family transcriptional regulator